MNTGIKKGLNSILLIDDNYSKYITLFSSFGEADNFNIKPFSKVNEGLMYLKSHDTEIGAVLLDLSFTPNNYEGIEVLQQIKKDYSLLPVFILIDSPSEKDMKMAINCMRDGALNYVIKINYEPTSLFGMIRVAVNQYQTNRNTERYNGLKEEYRNKILVYEKMLTTTEIILKNILEAKLMLQPTFENRVKSFRSFYNKLLKIEDLEGVVPKPFERITDLAGMRVIYYNADDLIKAVDLLTQNTDFVDMKNGGNPTPDDKRKTTGYRAVHFDVILNPSKRVDLEEYKILLNIPCEVQFKTIFAHSWSKVHHALSYKEIGQKKLSDKDLQKLNDNFENSAEKLEIIEQQITSMCKLFSQ